MVVEKGGRTLSALGTGDCFGEMGYFGKAPRSATIVAVNEVTAIRLSGSLMDQLSSGSQLRFLQSFVRTLSARLTKTSEFLSGA